MADILFHEIYNSYYRAVAKLLRAAQGQQANNAQGQQANNAQGQQADKRKDKCENRTLNADSAAKLISDAAFSESFLYILDAIQKEQWQIITRDFQTPLRYPPRRPLTWLERSWIAAVRLDPKMSLFEEKRLQSDTEPLYRPEDFYITDGLKHGDPYKSQTYRDVFRTVLQGVKEQAALDILYDSRNGRARRHHCYPDRLEYSEKDDKFRLLARERSGSVILNLSRMIECSIAEKGGEKGGTDRKADAETIADRSVSVAEVKQPESGGGGELRFSRKKRGRGLAVRGFAIRKNSVVLELKDERNALERCMIHFADLEKVTTNLEDRRYRIELFYRREDETEIVIRILSFGPFLRAVSPPEFVSLIEQRLKKQKQLTEQNLVSISRPVSRPEPSES